ncbi:MAG: discoidin domain-containing protein [Usitatibacter sp.]
MRWTLALLAALSCAATAAAEPREALLDDFEDLSAWSVIASDDVKAAIRQAPGKRGQALCLDFDFGKVSGYAVARRSMPLSFPGNFEFTFDIRGDAQPNALQFKLVDASGENVWWAQEPGFRAPREWRQKRIKKRHIGFAWGPAADRALVRSESLELAVASGSGGGKGSVCFDRLALRELPALNAPVAPPVASASSSAPGSSAALAVDGSRATAWRSDAGSGAEQTLSLDFGEDREFGGLVLRWLPGLHASRYAVETSDDAGQWRLVHEAASAKGAVHPILLGESQSRYLRLRMLDGPSRAYALAEIEIRDLAFGATPNAFFEAVARDAPRGSYPRGFSGKQVYWTVAGIDGGAGQGLLSEDGALEVRAGIGAIEPFLLTEEGLVSWANVETSHTLAEGYLPIPTVTWRRGDLALKVTAFGMGDRDRAQLVSRYAVENASASARSVTLVLALRPFQVNPPSQFLNTPGGVVPMHALEWNGAALVVDGVPRFHALQRPSEAFAVAFESGNLPEILASPPYPRRSVVRDATGFASAALLYRLEVPAGGSRSIGLVAPLAGSASLPAADPVRWMELEERAAKAYWKARLNHVALRLPAAGKPLADTLRTALAHVLINRAGPALQPGARAYARSWIRDGALTSEALLRLGHGRAVREFADWFATHQFASGKVPCCVDRRGADPVAENDSQGEWIHLVAEYYRYSRDPAWLRKAWPGIARAVGYMESLRLQERGAKNAGAGRAEYYGLMPPSISHEGYSDRPAYSYWDDFWALTGYRSAVEIAASLGRLGDARAIGRMRDEFRVDLRDSIRATMARHRIDFIPGSADRGDFDATSTTIALAPGGEGASLPREWIDATFERYWREFVARRGARDWDAYTPYELRNVGAFVRLGWRERAAELLEFFMADRRPAGWNQWAEVVGREPRKPRFIGDMPHGWVASDFIRSALDLFAFEREGDRAMVLAAGVPLAWMDGAGIAVEGLRTPWGTLGYRLRRDARGLSLTVAAGSAMPPGGLVLPWPFAQPLRCARVKGAQPDLARGEIRIATAPARVVAGIDAACR